MKVASLLTLFVAFSAFSAVVNIPGTQIPAVQIPAQQVQVQTAVTLPATLNLLKAHHAGVPLTCNNYSLNYADITLGCSRYCQSQGYNSGFAQECAGTNTNCHCLSN